MARGRKGENRVRDAYLACKTIKVQFERCYNNFKRKELPPESLEECETLKREYQGCILYYMDKFGIIRV